MNEKRKAKKQAPISYEDVSIDPRVRYGMKQMEKARNGDTKAFELITRLFTWQTNCKGRGYRKGWRPYRVCCYGRRGRRD